MNKLTHEQIEALIEQATHAALDAGCKIIQEALGVKAGDLAGTFFSGGEHADSVQGALRAYVRAEQSTGSERIGYDWQIAHSEAAESEGWSIFCSFADGSDPHVERDDEANLLASDAHACFLVINGTKPHHMAARSYIEAVNPAGYKLMQEEAAGFKAPEGYRVYLDLLPRSGCVSDNWIVQRPNGTILGRDYSSEGHAIDAAGYDAFSSSAIPTAHS